MYEIQMHLDWAFALVLELSLKGVLGELGEALRRAGFPGASG